MYYSPDEFDKIPEELKDERNGKAEDCFTEIKYQHLIHLSKAEA
jgi:hypothetical protein